MSTKEELIWKPQQGPQSLLISCHIQEIFYGGARGGGKTDGALGHWMYHSIEYGRNAIGLFVRRSMPELEDCIARARILFEDVAEWREQKKTLIFNNGAVLKFRFLEKDADADKYQGHNYSWICIEEAGNFPNCIPVDKLRATLRSAAGSLTWFILTGNPGGVGHNWLKARYIDPSPPLTPFIAETILPNGMTIKTKRIFIPSKLADNRILMENDPNYINNIAMAAASQKWLLDAWLDGNWNIVAGGMFDDLYDYRTHVLKPFELPASWEIYRSYDWGSAKPFSVGWYARTDGSQVRLATGELRAFVPNSLIRINEFYGWNGSPDQGLNMRESEIAEAIAEKEELCNYDVLGGPADPMIFNETQEESEAHTKGSLANYHYEKNIIWTPADKGLRVTGWKQCREMLAEARKPFPEAPCFYVFDTCQQWIRTVPTLPRSKANIDDIDTKAEDHIADEWRYMIRYQPQLITEAELSGF
jgi:hypothetical protein